MIMEKSLKIIISNLKQFISNNDLLRKVGLALIILFSLYLLNIIITTNFIGGDAFFSLWKSSKLAFLEKTSPYSNSADTLLIQDADSIGYIEPPFFNLPFFSLFFLFPLSFINDFEVARAIWMIILEICIFLSFYLIKDSFDGKSFIQGMFFLLIALLCNIYVISIIMQGFISPVILLLFLLSVRFLLKEKYEIGGIVLAFLLISPQIALIPTLFLLAFALLRKKWDYLIWFVITLAFLIVSSLLLNKNWVLEYFKNLLKNNTAFSYINTVKELFRIKNTIISYAILLIPLIIGVLEFNRTNKLNFQTIHVWNFYVILILNTLIQIQPDGSNLSFLIPGILLIYFSWNQTSSRGGRLIGSLIMIIFCLISLFWLFNQPQFLSGTIDISIQYLYIPVIFILLNLYWIRIWLIRSYQQSLINKF